MKKFVSLLLALMMALSLVACGSKADTTTDDKTDDDTVTEPANALEKIKAASPDVTITTLTEEQRQPFKDTASTVEAEFLKIVGLDGSKKQQKLGREMFKLLQSRLED